MAQKATDVELMIDSNGQMYIAFRFVNSPGLVHIRIDPEYGMDVGTPEQIVKDKKAMEEKKAEEARLKAIEEEKLEKKRKAFEKKRREMEAKLSKEAAELGIKIDKEYDEKAELEKQRNDYINGSLPEMDYAEPYNEANNIGQPEPEPIMEQLSVPKNAKEAAKNVKKMVKKVIGDDG